MWRLYCGLFILGGMLLQTGCNYPGMSAAPTGPSVREVRQTLEAISILAPGGEDPTAVVTSGEPAPTPPPLLPGGTPVHIPGGAPLDPQERIQYLTLSGDTLQALSGRFGVAPEMILSSKALPASGLIPISTEIWVPNQIGVAPFPEALLPDAEVVDSPAEVGFDLAGYIDRRGGYLSGYTDRLQQERLSGAEIIQRVSTESSVNPRLLLTLIEQRSGWVGGLHQVRTDQKYPLGFHVSGSEGLYKELLIAATHLNAGYYGWRQGTLTELQFVDSSRARLDPRLNAGSVAVQNLFAHLYRQDQLQDALYGPGGFLDTYRQLFGDPWTGSAWVEPLFPDGVSQPVLELPFAPGLRWSLTGGPHPSWKTGSPRGALDLAPVTGEPSCSVSYAWVTAPAPGWVARSNRNVVALDLDGDGYEQTGWVVIFMHVADRERVSAGVKLGLDDQIGHPSCEGGTSTGTHVHIARKYNGEWIAADGPLPFVLGGWQAYADERNYYGGLIKGSQQVVASPVGPRTSILMR